MTQLRYDMAQYYPLKAVLEEILGAKAYRKLKESGTLVDWRDECTRLLNAVDLAVKETVQIADNAWRAQVEEELGHGRLLLQDSQAIDDLLASLSATLIRLCFLQLGLLPSRGHRERVALRPEMWKLDAFRSVQYVQTEAQRDACARFHKKRRGT